MSNKRCPFCDGEARLSVTKDGSGDTFYIVVCKNCGNKTDGWRSVQKAEEMWNRRVDPTLLQLEIERIVSELKKIPTMSVAVVTAIKIVEGR